MPAMALRFKTLMEALALHSPFALLRPASSLAPSPVWPPMSSPRRTPPSGPAAPQAVVGSWTWDALRKSVWGDAAPTAPHRDPIPVAEVGQDSLWSRLACVGVSLQKKMHGEDEGYASDDSEFEGESHLIRIMKRHHVAKARSTQDLPDWLFSDPEVASSGLRPFGGPAPLAVLHQPSGGSGDEDWEPYQHHRPSGLSDIFDSVEKTRPSSGSPRGKQSFDSGYGSSSGSSSGSPCPVANYALRDGARERPAALSPLGRNRLAGTPPSRHRAPTHPAATHHESRPSPSDSNWSGPVLPASSRRPPRFASPREGSEAYDHGKPSPHLPAAQHYTSSPTRSRVPTLSHNLSTRRQWDR